MLCFDVKLKLPVSHFIAFLQWFLFWMPLFAVHILYDFINDVVCSSESFIISLVATFNASARFFRERMHDYSTWRINMVALKLWNWFRLRKDYKHPSERKVLQSQWNIVRLWDWLLKPTKSIVLFIQTIKFGINSLFVEKLVQSLNLHGENLLPEKTNTAIKSRLLTLFSLLHNKASESVVCLRSEAAKLIKKRNRKGWKWSKENWWTEVSY